MAISDRLNKLTTDITNAYTSIENKGGTIPSDKNTDNLHTAIDSIQSSNIIGATAEGESLNLTNTKAMPYSDYVVEGKSEQDGEPSPSNPSEIHSVADDVNLFNVSSCSFGYINSQGQAAGSEENANVLTDYIKVESNKNYTISLNTTLSNIGYALFDNNKNYISRSNNYSRDSLTILIPNEVSYIRVWLNKNSLFTNIEEILNYQPMIKKGTTSTPYSPYNQGTVTIKQRGKNKFDYKQITLNPSRTIENGGFVINDTSFQHGNVVGKLKNLCPELKVGDKFKFNWDTNATRNNSDVNYIYLNLYANTIRKDITYTCTQEMLDSETYFYGQQGEYYKDIIFYLDGQTSDYEPYQGNDYTIQTEPLRSLRNGVKDTMEADGIHRRVGSQILTDIEYLSSTTVFGVEAKFGAYGLIGVKDENRNYNFMSDKIAPANENFLKYGAYRNQEALIVMTSSDDTLENFNLKISGSEVLYELATEVIEPLTQNQATTMLDIIKTGSYEGTTNIYTDEDVKPTIGVGYYKKG